LKKDSNNIQTLIETIERDKNLLKDSTIGISSLDKAIALLCVFSNVAGVYSTTSTKKGLAVLIRAGIPGQTEEIILNPKLDKNSKLSYEERVSFIDSPDYAYKILKEEAYEKK
jgi:hypothetical protein